MGKRIILFLFFVCSLFCSTNAQEKVFKLHFGDKLGVNFENEVIETETQNIMQPGMPYLYAGGGVVIEDFNYDGLPDIFLLGNQVSSKIFINQGDLKFLDYSTEMGISTNNWCSGVLVCDVNMDGFKDIYILKARNNSEETAGNMLFVNYNGKYFKEESKKYKLDFNGRFLSGSFFDYDQDGDQDLYLARYPDDSKGNSINFDFNSNIDKIYGTDILLENVKNKFFKNVSEKAGIKGENGAGISVITSDFNNDNLLDIYVGNDFAESDFLFLNLGNGKFEESLKEHFNHTSFFTMGSDFGDLNNDGLPDLITLDMNPPELSKYKMDFSSFDYSIYERTNTNYSPQEIRNSLQIQNSDGTFSEIGQLDKFAFTDWSWSPIICDFNLDGNKDIFITNGLKRDILNQSIYMLEIDSLLRTNNIFRNDELLKYIPKSSLRNYFFNNTGNNNFENVSEDWLVNIKSISNGAAIADLDLDGDIDIVVNNIDTFPFVYENLSKKKSISFSTRDYKFLNTKVEIEINGIKILEELRTCKGFISSSQPIFSVPILDNEEEKIRLTFHYNLKNRKSTIETILKSDSVYYVEDFYKNFDEIEEKRSKQENELSKIRDIDFQKQNFKINPLAIKSKSHQSLTKKLYGKEQSRFYIGESFTKPASIISLDENDDFVLNNLIQDGFKDIDLVQLNENVFFLLSKNKENEYIISKIEHNNKLIERKILLKSKKEFFKIGLLKNKKEYLFAFSENKFNEFPFNLEHEVFSIDKNSLKKHDGFSGELNVLLNNQIISDIETSSNKERIFLAGVYEKPAYIFLDDENHFQLEIFSNNKGYFDNIHLDNNSGQLLYSNIGKNFRFNLKAEDSLSVYFKDFDGDLKLDQLVCASISGKDYPIYTYNDFSKYISGVRKYVPEVRDYFQKSIDEIFYDIKYTKHDVKTINSINNLVFDEKFLIEKIGIPQITSLNSVFLWDNFNIFSGGSSQFNPVFGIFDAAEIIMSNETSESNIFNGIITDNIAFNVSVLNVKSQNFIIVSPSGVFSYKIRNE